MTEIVRDGLTRGAHGLDPRFDSNMNGVFWGNPVDKSQCPEKMADIASKVWKLFDREWTVEFAKKRTSPADQIPLPTPQPEIR